MRVAYSVSKVRAAEAALMALVPDGALMQRAAAGLASVCAGLLRDGAGGVYGARVVVLAGTGDNGGGALYAGGGVGGPGARAGPPPRPAAGSPRGPRPATRTRKGMPWQAPQARRSTPPAMASTAMA